jgi:naphthoate synthase
MTKQVSEIFDASIWHEVPGFEALEDITYHKHNELGIVRIACTKPSITLAWIRELAWSC